MRILLLASDSPFRPNCAVIVPGTGNENRKSLASASEQSQEAKPTGAAAPHDHAVIGVHRTPSRRSRHHRLTNAPVLPSRPS